jgi:hypothetical protein
VERTRSTPTVQVVCADCGDEFGLSRRTVLDHRRRGMPDLCHSCRHPDSGAGLAAIAAARKWWLQTYSLEEIQSWPPLP